MNENATTKETTPDYLTDFIYVDIDKYTIRQLIDEIQEWKHRAIGGTCRILSLNEKCDCSLCQRDRIIFKLKTELKQLQTKNSSEEINTMVNERLRQLSEQTDDIHKLQEAKDLFQNIEGNLHDRLISAMRQLSEQTGDINQLQEEIDLWQNMEGDLDNRLIAADKIISNLVTKINKLIIAAAATATAAASAAAAAVIAASAATSACEAAKSVVQSTKQ